MFVPGLGFNEGSFMMELILRGGDTLNNPVAFSYMAGVGDKVSYALISERTRAEDPWGVCGDNQDEPSKLLVPVETGAFTFVFTHWWRCPVGNPGCQGGGRLFYRRYFILGEGDVASILDIAHKIWEEPVGKVRGGVYDRNTENPYLTVRCMCFGILWPRSGGSTTPRRMSLSATPFEATRGGWSRLRLWSRVPGWRR